MSFSTPTPTQTLQARPPQPGMPGGVTPELIQLLAQMKVKQATDAAARDLAMKQGQQPPTVAEGVQQELERNATAEIMQKMAPQGLRALAPQAGAGQGQNMQAQQAQQMAAGQPQMPPGAPMPPQQMARGGVVALRSNLPKQYAGGGIVAFEGGGTTSEEDMAEWRKQRRGETDMDYALRMEAGPNFNKANPDSFGAGVAEWLRESLGRAGNDARALTTRPGDERMQQPVRANMENDPRLVTPQADPAAAPAVAPPKPPTDIVDLATGRAGSGSAGASQRVSMSGASGAADGRPVMDPSQVKFGEDTQNRVSANMARDPEKIKAAALAEWQRIMGPDHEMAIANQKQGLEKLQALQEAGQAQRPGSFLRGLQLMGKNVNRPGGFGGAMHGVSEGIHASNAAYSKEDIGFQEKLNTLQAAMDKATNENNIGMYNAAKEAFDKAVVAQTQAVQSGVQLTGVHENNATRRQGAYDSAQARILQAKEMHARASEAAAARNDWKAQKMLEMRAQAAATYGEKVAAQEGKQMKNQVDDSFDPAARAAVIAAEQLEKDPIYQDTLKKLGIKLDGPKPDPMADKLALAKQELARRQQGK